MSANTEVLRLLFPMDLAGDLQDDLGVDGRGLDAAQARAERLLVEMYPDVCEELIASWEQVCGVVPEFDWPLQTRRSQVVSKLREKGDIKRPYFVALAASWGWEITIDDLVPFMANWGRAGDTIYIQDAIYIWIVTVYNQDVYYFRSGESAAGERLCWWLPATFLEWLLNDLKPAEVFMVFTPGVGRLVDELGDTLTDEAGDNLLA